MNKSKITILALASCIILAGCGTSTNTTVSWSKSAPAAMMNTMESYDDYYYTGGDYSDTYIDGDQVDYSYGFSAEGDTDKTKEDMLKDYESIQTFVTDKGGYIEYVNNSYDHYTDENIRRNDFARKYIASGSLNFTVQIDNDDVPAVVEELEKICQNNRFTVTSYTQRIQNYKSWNVVDEYEEGQRGRVISKEDLDRKLKYADISVNILYNIPRNKLSYAFYGIKAEWLAFWDTAKDLVRSVIALAVALTILFLQAILFYKGFIKAIHKNKLKHPEYYHPKDVNIVSDKFRA